MLIFFASVRSSPCQRALINLVSMRSSLCRRALINYACNHYNKPVLDKYASVRLTRAPECTRQVCQRVLINGASVSSLTAPACPNQLCQHVLVPATMCAHHLRQCARSLIKSACTRHCASVHPSCATAAACARQVRQHALEKYATCAQNMRQCVLVPCASVRT